MEMYLKGEKETVGKVVYQSMLRLLMIIRQFGIIIF